MSSTVVKDSSGGVLPGVTVTLHNTESGASRTTVSEDDGQYRFGGLGLLQRFVEGLEFQGSQKQPPPPTERLIK